MSIRILQGDVREMLNQIPDGSIQTCVTSPPYFQLRRYLDVNDPMAQFELGSESTPAEFVQNLVDVFALIRPKMRDDSTVWINIGDSYAGSGKGPTGHNGIGDQEQRQGFRQGNPSRWANGVAPSNRDGLGGVTGIPAKNLLLIPERFSLAMQDAGWWVRSRIAWCKTSAMPESVVDRPTSAWEHIFMFTRSRTYYYDAEAVRQPATMTPQRRFTETTFGRKEGIPNHIQPDQRGALALRNEPAQEYSSANLRNFWLLGPAPSSLEHFASFVPEIPRRCILAGTSQAGQCAACSAPWRRVVERGDRFAAQDRGTYGYALEKATGDDLVKMDRFSRTGMMPGQAYERSTTGWSPSCACKDAGPPIPQTVLDPFAGSFTTSLVAERLGRNSIGIELSPAYVEIGRKRLEGDCPMFADVLDAPEAGAAPSASSEPALSAEKGQAQQAELWEGVAG